MKSEFLGEEVVMLSLKKIFFFFLNSRVTLMCSQVEALREAMLLNPGLSQHVYLCPVMSQSPGPGQSRRLSACYVEVRTDTSC